MRTNLGRLTATAALSLACALGASPAGAQTFTILHTFTGGADGAGPLDGLTLDRRGNVYGTAAGGGSGYGTAFELKHGHNAWTLDVLYSFLSGSDGAAPGARLMPGPHGRLYSTTAQGGGGGGPVFDLHATPKGALKSKATLFAFGGANGYQPSNGDLTFDANGNMYGTTSYGGTYNLGTVFELSNARGVWKETILHSFGYGADGTVPIAGVILDPSGNLYGTTSTGGNTGNGTVYELSPGHSGWTESVLYNFQGSPTDGETPYAGLTFDPYGNLYGGATDGGSNGGGTIFELARSGGGWMFEPLYSTPGTGVSGPFRTPYVDANGNVFGTTHCDGAYSAGSVYELTRSGSTWTYTSLHDFTGGSDGGYVFANPVFDAHGNIYGTTQIGGAGYGVVWEISP
jgi:uncharacterized repeat protein (TIGR03803 family)